jgi:alpha-L-glutamate ligase-like protein
MHWLFTAARRLRELGVVGINHRNAACILDHNPRAQFPLVDDKLRLQALCERLGVPFPAPYATVDSHAQLRRLPKLLQGRSDFVVKPNRGSGGRGILVVVGRDGDAYVRHNGERLPPAALRQHLSDVLSGMHSLGGRPDQALLQQRVRLHPALAPVAYKGIPDVRVILYRREPAMAMLRLPTSASNGRANLHQGGIGAGVDLDTGMTRHAVLHNQPVAVHPDTGGSLVGVRVPYWPAVIAMARRVAGAVGLGYLGVDIVVDADEGPLLLEANARPGLAIQMANAEGLLPRLAAIDARHELGEAEETPDVLPLRPAYRKSA